MQCPWQACTLTRTGMVLWRHCRHCDVIVHVHQLFMFLRSSSLRSRCIWGSLLQAGAGIITCSITIPLLKEEKTWKSLVIFLFASIALSWIDCSKYLIFLTDADNVEIFSGIWLSIFVALNSKYCLQQVEKIGLRIHSFWKLHLEKNRYCFSPRSQRKLWLRCKSIRRSLWKLLAVKCNNHLRMGK